MVTVHVLVRLLVFSFLVIGVLRRLLSWLQKLADVVVLHWNVEQKSNLKKEKEKRPEGKTAKVCDLTPRPPAWGGHETHPEPPQVTLFLIFLWKSNILSLQFCLSSYKQWHSLIALSVLLGCFRKKPWTHKWQRWPKSLPFSPAWFQQVFANLHYEHDGKQS